jgi:Flp pilus assembly protein TadD
VGMRCKLNGAISSGAGPLTIAGRAGATAIALAIGLMLAGCAAQGNSSTAPTEEVNADSIMRIADSTRQSGNLGQAANLYLRAAQMYPKDVKPLVALGGIYGQMNLPAQASEAWQAALALDPKNDTALRGLANAQIQNGDANGAIRNLRAAQAIKPDWRNDNSLGVAYDMLGDRANAQAAYRDGLVLAPDNLQLNNNLGLSQALSGDFAHALPLLEATARNPAATPRMRQNLALAYGLSGDDKKAAEIAKLDLNASQVQQNAGYYEFLRLLQDRSKIAAMLGAHQADQLN